MLADWVERHTSEAPAALRTRVQQHVMAADGGPTVPAALARAARQALDQVLTHPGDRSVALDLLAADALITLALLAQAQRAPEGLSEFAGSILHSVRPDA
ncbi:MAG TPA: hypothetical protein VHR41_00275 [Gemmatimonadales bacterium]|nr:hypothetical protein [Gemmatimonadales bacterium]